MSEVLIYGAHSSIFFGERNGKFVRFVTTKRDFKSYILSDNFSMIIIDLDSRENEGFQLAEYVRQIPRACYTPILFFAKNRKLEKRAFHEIHCYDYYVKPLSNDDIIQIVYLCTRSINRKNSENTIIFQVGKDRYPVPKDDILFLEVCERSVIVNTVSINLEIPYLILDDFMAGYGDSFLRIHRSIVVNKSHVRCIDLKNSTAELDDGRLLEIGRKYLNGIKDDFV